MKLAIWFDENDFARLTRADEHLAETYAANSIDDNDAYDSAKWVRLPLSGIGFDRYRL